MMRFAMDSRRRIAVVIDGRRRLFGIADGRQRLAVKLQKVLKIPKADPSLCLQDDKLAASNYTSTVDELMVYSRVKFPILANQQFLSQLNNYK